MSQLVKGFNSEHRIQNLTLSSSYQKQKNPNRKTNRNGSQVFNVLI